MKERLQSQVNSSSILQEVNCSNTSIPGYPGTRVNCRRSEFFRLAYHSRVLHNPQAVGLKRTPTASRWLAYNLLQLQSNSNPTTLGCEKYFRGAKLWTLEPPSATNFSRLHASQTWSSAVPSSGPSSRPPPSTNRGYMPR